MKKRLVLTAMFSLMLALGLALVGCDTGNGDDGNGSPGGDGNDSMGTATTLVNGVFTSGTSISPEGDVDWYKFEATIGHMYILTWDDSDGSGTYAGDIKVSAYQSDGATVLNGISSVDSGYSTPKTISGYTGTVYIKVQGHWSYSNGSYIIKYTQN
jgi:hypothetical protein